MNTEYAIFVLKSRIRDLQDKVAEIDDELYSHHPKEQVDKLRSSLIEKEKDLCFAIEKLTKTAE